MLIGILGAGHAGVGIAAWLCHKGAQVMLWAPSNHPGAVPAIRASGGRVNAMGVINAAFNVLAVQDLAVIVQRAKLLIIITRSDAHDCYVNALEEYNHMLSETDIVTLSGHGFTMIYADRLKARRIVETNNPPAASKLTGPVSVHIKMMKEEMEVSCFPIEQDLRGHPSVPEDIQRLLTTLFQIRIISVAPLQIAFYSNFITHAVAATLNIGRLCDPPASLTETAKNHLMDLDGRDPPSRGYYFYGRGSNTFVCAVQQAVDRERCLLARDCGLSLRDILTENNDEYATAYVNLREYSSAPSPHNLQHVCPDDIEHRYYSEEMRPMEVIFAISEIVGRSIPLTAAVIHLVQAARSKQPFTSPAYQMIRSFTYDDLIRFGARTGISCSQP